MRKPKKKMRGRKKELAKKRMANMRKGAVSTKTAKPEPRRLFPPLVAPVVRHIGNDVDSEMDDMADFHWQAEPAEQPNYTCND